MTLNKQELKDFQKQSQSNSVEDFKPPITDIPEQVVLKGVTYPLSSKVIENWLNQTLTDAENMDIPSVLLLPKDRVPITRYGIDQLTLIKAGLSSEMCERIYRALFVYSIGFFETVSKMLLHNCSAQSYLVVSKSIWKVFSVLLEVACKTDYRLLISKVTDEHEKEKQ